MTVPRLNGWWDEIAPAFNDFSKKLPDIINPNRKFLEGVREQLATDPAMLQKYADMELQSPGTLERMGLGGLADQVRNMGGSSGMMIENRTRNILSQPLDEDEESQVRAKTLQIKDPLARKQDKADLKKTEVDIAYTEANTVQTKLQNEIAELTKDGKLAEAQMKIEALQTYQAAKQVVDNLKTNLNGLSPFQAYQKNLLSPEEVAALHAVPEYQSAWQSEFEVWKEKSDQALAKERNSLAWKQYNANGPEEEVNKQRARIAGQVSQYAGVSIDDVMAYQKIPLDQKTIVENTPIEELTPQQQAMKRGYIATQKYTAKLGAQEARAQLKLNDSRIRSLTEDLHKATTRDQKIGIINNLNAVYEETYIPLVEMGMKQNIPRIVYKPNWREAPKELIWSHSDPEVLEQASMLGLKIAGPEQTKLDVKTSSDPKYESAAKEILSMAKNEVELEQLLMEAANSTYQFDKNKLRVTISRMREKKK